MSRGPDADTLVTRAILASAATHGVPLRATDGEWRRWASATFTGARHRMLFEAAPGAALDRWLLLLPDTELPLRGHLVADIAVTARQDHADHVAIAVEALTVEEG